MSLTSQAPGPNRTSHRSRLWKLARIIAGFFLIAVGLVLSVPGVPGPGFAVIIVGLALLAEHFAWARRWLDWGKAKFEQTKERLRARRPAPGA